MEASPSSRPASVARASFVLFGTIVGAGIFGLPYVIQQAGYGIGLFWLVVLTGAVSLTHLMFASIILRTPGEHRFVGYVGIHLGSLARKVETVSSTLGLFGSNLAYLILGGLFIGQILAPIFDAPAMMGSMIMFLFGVWAVAGGVAFLSKIDFWLTVAELLSFLLLTAIAFTAFDAANLAAPLNWGEAFLPYGLVLYAYGGLSAVMEVRSMVAGDPRKTKKAVAIGTLMAAGLTTLFVTAIIGALGAGVTEESVAGMVTKFGGALPVIGGITGFISILTSYIVFTAYTKNMFQRDFGWKRALASVVAVGVPLAMLLAGVTSFGRILELVGSVLLGLSGIFVGLMYMKIKKTPAGADMRIPSWAAWFLMAIYGGGIVYELVFRVFRGH